MTSSIAITFPQESTIIERLLGDMKLLYRLSIQKKSGRAKPKIEEPDEENMDYDSMAPGREGTPDTGAEPTKENPGAPDHPDVSVPEDPKSQATYSGEQEEALPTDITGAEAEKKPELEEDKFLKNSGNDVTDTTEEDQNDNNKD